MRKTRRGGGENMVIGGYSGTKILSSPDGNTWIGRTPNAFGSIANGVAYGNGLWVAVGNNNGNASIKTVSTSSDGITWNGQTSNGGITECFNVAYGKNSLGNGVWVMCGQNKIATSPNGTSWAARATNGGLDSEIRNVAFGKDNLGADLWIATGFTSVSTKLNIVRSTDGGNTWVACATNGGIKTVANCAAYGLDGSGQPLWVAGGEGGLGGNTIATSTDGNTWYPCDNSKVGGLTINVRGVAYGKDDLGVGLWVAVGEGTNRIATSPNGTTWTGRSVAGLTNSGNSVAYGKNNLGIGLWIAVGNGGNLIATSSNGTAWTGIAPNGGGYYYNGNIYDRIHCVAFKN